MEAVTAPAKTGSLGGHTATLGGSSGWVGVPYSVARGLDTGLLGGGGSRDPVLSPVGSTQGGLAGTPGSGAPGLTATKI